ncbi:MAG TPA: alpha/beta fold hydrolase [Solirubrobacterales bacterium]
MSALQLHVEEPPAPVAGGARARLLAGTGAEERRLRIAGVSTAVLEAGAGPPLVLLHGGIECGGVYWAPVIARLAESHRVLAPDVPGLGASEPLGRLDVESFSSWLSELVREGCGEPAALVAHSMFGAFAARFAAAHGELLDRLVLYGAPGIGPYRIPVGLQLAAIRAELRPTMRNQERFLPWPFLDPERVRRSDPGWFEAFLEYLLATSRLRRVKRTMHRVIAIGRKRIPDAELSRIATPTALVWGRHDRMTPLGLAERARDRFGWPLEVVEDVGHVPHVEAPAAFLRALERAFSSLDERFAALLDREEAWYRLRRDGRA